MVITPIVELQDLDKFELIDRVHRAELQARNAEALLRMERERVAEAVAALEGGLVKMERAAGIYAGRFKGN